MFPITDKSQKSVDMFLTNRQNVDMFLDAILRTGSNQWTSSRLLAQVWISSFISSCHVETVVLLSDKKVDGHISIDLDVEKLESKSGTATYAEIKAYIKEKYGLSDSSLYIGQIKDKVGIKERKNYNTGSGNGRVPTCPPEKEEAIMDAFRHFNLI